MTHDAAAIVAHTMMYEDAAWAADIIYSAQKASERVAALLPTLLIGTWSRIIYEGSIALKSRNASIAVPVLADLLEHQHRDVLARARHSTKLLDDTKKGYEEVLDDLTAYHAAHQAQFTGNAVPFARWFECDLGLTTLDGHLVGTTITTHIHLGQPPTLISDTDAMGAAITAASIEQGSALAVLLGLGGQFEPRPTLDLSALNKLKVRDRASARYLRNRYDPSFPPALKLLLVGIEADLGTCQHVLPVLEPGHADTVFRARVATLFHALNALREIATRHARPDGSSHPALASVVNDTAVQRLATAPARTVRNRCVHYEIRRPIAGQRPRHRRPSTVRSPNPARPDAADYRPRPAAAPTPNPPLRSPIQSVWVASFSTVAMASFSSVVDISTEWPGRPPSRFRRGQLQRALGSPSRTAASRRTRLGLLLEARGGCP
nr:hypothetical protein [Knoellia aerolata]